MGEKKLFDLVAATGEEVTDLALTEALPSVVKELGAFVVSEGVAEIAGELVGAVFPRLNNIRLSYKQNRLERNVKHMLKQLIENDKILSDRITNLEQSKEGKDFIRQSEELMLDGIVDEIQPQKVKYNVNGFINLLQTDDANMDMALMFFKTLYELNDVDIKVLSAYYDGLTVAKSKELYEEIQIDFQELRFVKEKLYRLGLLNSRNKEIASENMKSIMEYLKQMDKDNRSSKPKGVKIPRFKNEFLSDSYSITHLGRT